MRDKDQEMTDVNQYGTAVDDVELSFEFLQTFVEIPFDKPKFVSYLARFDESGRFIRSTVSCIKSLFR